MKNRAYVKHDKEGCWIECANCGDIEESDNESDLIDWCDFMGWEFVDKFASCEQCVQDYEEEFEDDD